MLWGNLMKIAVWTISVFLFCFQTFASNEQELEDSKEVLNQYELMSKEFEKRTKKMSEKYEQLHKARGIPFSDPKTRAYTDGMLSIVEKLNGLEEDSLIRMDETQRRKEYMKLINPYSKKHESFLTEIKKLAKTKSEQEILSMELSRVVSNILIEEYNGQFSIDYLLDSLKTHGWDILSKQRFSNLKCQIIGVTHSMQFQCAQKGKPIEIADKLQRWARLIDESGLNLKGSPDLQCYGIPAKELQKDIIEQFRIATEVYKLETGCEGLFSTADLVEILDGQTELNNEKATAKILSKETVEYISGINMLFQVNSTSFPLVVDKNESCEDSILNKRVKETVAMVLSRKKFTHKGEKVVEHFDKECFASTRIYVSEENAANMDSIIDQVPKGKLKRLASPISIKAQ